METPPKPKCHSTPLLEIHPSCEPVIPVQSCLVPNTVTNTLVCSQLHAAVTPHTLRLPLHTRQLTIILSPFKELYSQVKTWCESSHAHKSSLAWAPALPRSSQEGGPEQALPQNLLQVAARRLAPTPGGTSPGWKGEDHSSSAVAANPWTHTEHSAASSG